MVADDFATVNRLIPERLTSDVNLVEEIGQYIVESGGKRLRPLLVLLAAKCVAQGCESQSGQQQAQLAAVIEFLHTATLLHDDVVDHSALRRGRSTANSLWGNAPSVLVGDFLYSRAFQLMVELGRLEILSILSNATNVIAEGEVLQLANIGNTELSEADYLEVIKSKTAMLFQASTESAAVLTNATNEQRLALKNFGLNFGLAYQLVDDWLDYAGDAELMGKNVGDDLAEGKATLPLIYTITNGNPDDVQLVKTALTDKSTENMQQLLEAVKRSGALNYTQDQARGYIDKAEQALVHLPDNEFRSAMHDLASYAALRLS